MDALNTATPNLADKPTLADGPPRILVHQTWKTNLLWQMDPPILTSSGQEWQFQHCY